MIPTYNESENIVPMLKLVSGVLSKLKKYTYQILVVDDNSPDGTGKLVKSFSLKYPRVLLLPGKKQGLGKAMTRGYLHSINKLKADIVITNEADFSYNPKEVIKMISVMEKGYDAVLGSRKVGNTSNWPATRKFIHFVANSVFAGVVAGVNQVEDHNSAFKIIRVKNILSKMDFSDFPKGFAFFNYLTYRLFRLTDKVYEYKTVFTPRTRGVSKMMLRDGIEYAKNCFKIRYEKLT